jgi:hypothetical protein
MITEQQQQGMLLNACCCTVATHLHTPTLSLRASKVKMGRGVGWLGLGLLEMTVPEKTLG